MTTSRSRQRYSRIKMAEAESSFLITLKDLFDKKGLTFEDVQGHKCSENVLIRLSKCLDNWEMVALYLGLTRAEIKGIKFDSNSEEERRINVLKKWKEKNGERATYYNLIKALKESDRVDIIEQTLNFLNDCAFEKDDEQQKRREMKEKSPDNQKPQQSKSSNPVEKQIPNLRPTGISTSWQKMKFEQRRKNKPPISSPSDLTSDNYQQHFYSALWFEEDEHIKKLSKKCDGINYKFTIFDHKEVPPFLDRHPRPNVCYGYISGLSDDEIEYATQASDDITILRSDGSDQHLTIAFKHYYNFNHIENCLYVVASHSPELSEAIKNGTRVKGGSEINISAQFTLKYSYFDHLHESVVKTPEHVRKCLLLPDASSFGDLFLTFDPQHSSFDCIKLDDEQQLKALKIIVSESSLIGEPFPPIILYGPFGTGKTRILARAAFEVMMNGINENKHARILISAHHEISITTFIFAYFGVMRKRFYLPFKVILITKQENKGVYADMYMTPEEFAMHSADICTLGHVIIIATYTMSLNLYQYLYSPEGFFTHLFLDEAAQVREPEAITPLALATKDAKIVLAGDMQQVGPNILVLGKEARMFGLHISLLERLLIRYKEVGPVATHYITKLSVNYQSHNSLMCLPNLFYKHLELNTDEVLQSYCGPTGYNFVSVDSRIIDHPDKQWIEACVVLEEVRSYLETMKQLNLKFNPRHDVCIIASTRKQLNLIKSMAYMYKEYEAVRNVSYKPSFVIQGHEFQAIFLSLENDGMNIKSLFNPYVFNTVITRAKFYVVAIGFPEEVKKFELTTLFHPDRGGSTVQCWHEYLKLCGKLRTLRLFDFSNPLLPYKISGIKEKGGVPEIVSRDEELQSYTLSQDKMSDYILTLNDNVKSLTEKLNSREKEVSALKVALHEYEEEIQSSKERLIITEKELCQCELQLKEKTETLDKMEDDWKQLHESKKKEEVALNACQLELKEKTETLKKMEDDFKQLHESRREEIATLNKISKAKDKEIERLTESKLKSLEIKEEKTTFSQNQELELDKETVKAADLYEFRSPSAKMSSIGVMYTIFILLLVAMCWKPDPRIFIGPLPGVKVIASNRFLVVGGQSSQLHWEEYGLMLDIPSDALPFGFLAEVVIRVSVSGPYIFPDQETWKPASAVYWISSSKEFVNPVLLGIWHNVKGSVNSSSIKVLTAEDTPQNMIYIFKEFVGDFSVNGSYVFFKLTGFSGKEVVTSCNVNNFQGALFYKTSKANKWDYSLVIYRSQVKGVTRSLFDDTKYKDWIQEIEEFGVLFEENSTVLELNITANPPVESWEIREKFTPLSYHKDELQIQDHIESNMQFMLHWRGSGPFRINNCLRFSLNGAKRPTTITVNPNIINHDSTDTKFTETRKNLGIKDLNTIVSALKDSSFDCSKWSDLGLKLGLIQTRLNTIKSDNSKDAEACLEETLVGWLNLVDDVEKNGGTTWNTLVDALGKIDQKAVAERLKDLI